MNLLIIAFFCNDKKNSVLLLFPEHVHQGVSALLTLPPCLLAAAGRSLPTNFDLGTRDMDEAISIGGRTREMASFLLWLHFSHPQV